MLKIAICDDDEWMRQYMQSVISRRLGARADLYASGEELLAAETEYDILLIDICLNETGGSRGIDGMETARQMRRRSGALIIFITAMPDYVYDAYDVEAFHYLLKPVDEEKLLEVLKRAAAKVKEKAASPSLVIRANGKYLPIPAGDIFYGENEGRKIILHTRGGSYSYYEKMDVLEKKLGSAFFRSHRGYLVSLAEVAEYDRTSITLKCGDTVFLAKQKYNDFVAAYMDYLSNG